MKDQTKQKLKKEFREKRGYWNEFWEGLLTLDSNFFEAYLKFSSIPWTSGVLEPKVKEFIYIAIDSATTHLYEPGLRIHIENAFKHGATKEEIMEVYQLTSVLGMHTCTVGVPILIEEIKKAGNEQELNLNLNEHQTKLKEEFQEKRGYWNEFWEGLLSLDPNFFEAYLKFSSIPWTNGVLEPKIKEFIYIAIDSATTHLYEPGLRIHIENAFKYGAKKEEIMEVFQLTSVLGMHTCTVGVPILIEEMRKANIEF
jgi:alkylhydroperoxidase/carboxymuconolactone decarboxylase family protein YurZ